MCLRIVIRFLTIAALLAAGPGFAQGPPDFRHQPDLNNNPTALKPVAVIYFTDAPTGDHSDAIHRVIRRARDDFHLSIQEYALSHEAGLPEKIEKIAEDDIGLIIIVEPHKLAALMKIPGLYPDISFSIIDIPAPLYLTNVHSITFREEEGAYLMGALAALHSRIGGVTFLSAEDNKRSRDLAYAFSQGAHYVSHDIQIVRQLGARIRHGKILPGDGADITFVLDSELLPAALRSAKEEKELVIPYGQDLTANNPGVVLTSLLKHYDLTIYAILQDYRRQGWKPGSESLGIGDGYLDYVLDDYNKGLLSKSVVERVEMIKDLISQGIIRITPLDQ